MAQTLFHESGEDPLSAAIRRLDKALSMLESKVTARALHQHSQDNDLFEDDRLRMAAELNAARARERALEEIAAEASAALGRAAAEVRAALTAEEI